MALTKISTDGVKDDAITKAKIPADQIEASELANNAVDTNAIADQAVTLDKLPHGDSNNDGKFLRANNGADPTFETVSTDLVADTSPQLGGNLDTNSHEISLDDSHAVIFGDGSDLRILHDGTDNVITCDGGQNLRLVNHLTGGNESMIKCIPNGSTETYHNGNLRGYTVSNGFYVDQEQFDDDADVILENKYASLSDNKQSRFIARVDRDAGGSHGGGNRAAVFGHNYNGSTGGGGFFDIRSNDGTNRLFYMDNNTNLRVNFGASNIGTSNGTVVGSQSSDIRNKNLVGDGTVPYGLAEILKLNPIKYQYKKELKDRIGFSAQQVEPIIPESVYDTGEDKDILDNEITGDTIKAMYYVDLIPVLVNAIKELSAKIDTLEVKVAALEAA